MTDTLTPRSERPVLRLERAFRHPAEKVWRAVTEPAQLSQWYPATATQLDLKQDGTIVFDYGEGWIATATITELDPPRVLEFLERAPEPMERETDNLCRIELIPDGTGCLMIFTQHFSDRPAAASYASGWQGCFKALDQVLDGVPPTDEPVSVDIYQRYIREFELDIGAIETRPDGWTIRFERQLMRQPLPKVWSVLTDGVEPGPAGKVPAELVPEGLHARSLTSVLPGTSLAYDWDDHGANGTVTWELSQGPGGARIHLTQTGMTGTSGTTGTSRASDTPDTYLDRWRGHIEALVDRINSTPS